MIKIKPVQDSAGAFLGFSAFIGNEWSAARPYKELMRSIADSGSDPICAAKRFHKRVGVERRRSWNG